MPKYVPCNLIHLGGREEEKKEGWKSMSENTFKNSCILLIRYMENYLNLEGKREKLLGRLFFPTGKPISLEKLFIRSS